jgi:uncharacterized membrane protein HdeD (DUF308 family)
VSTIQLSRAQQLPSEQEVARGSKVLRVLYLTRVAFVGAWVLLADTLASSSQDDNTARILVGVLLVAYPVSDVAATIFEIRANRSMTMLPHYANFAAGVLATSGLLITGFTSVPAAMSIFGVWAILSGVAQILVGVIRRQTFRGQWPMIISGIGSLGGAGYIGWSGTAGSALGLLAEYAEGGAFFYLLTSLWLFLAPRQRRIQAGTTSFR